MSDTSITPSVFIPKSAPHPTNETKAGTFPYRRKAIGDVNDQHARQAKDPRLAHDTVTLSESRQKMVNLNRGNELADEIRNAPTDESFANRLSTALEDIRRIGRLFSETLKAAFRIWR